MNIRPLASVGLLASLAFLAVPSTGCDGDKGIDGETEDGGATDGGGTTDGGTDAGTETPDDCGDTVETACAFNPDDKTGSVDMEEQISEGGDRDWFKMTLGAGDTVAVGTIAYADDGDGEPDTVLRLYDSAGTLQATNDDMPFRLQETDSALYFQAPTDGDYILEVLDWSDWDPDTEADGGDSYDYEITAYFVGQLDPEPDNDTAEGIDAWVDTNGSLPMYANGWTDDTGLPYLFLGDMDSVGDVDLYPMSWDTKDGSRVWCQYSVWPTWLPNLDPTFRLWDDSGNIVAENDEPMHSLDRYYHYDGWVMMPDQGVVFGMADETSYYLEVSDSAGNSGIGTFYPGIMECYGWNTEVVTVEDIDIDNNTIILSTDLIMNAFTDETGALAYVAGGIDGMAVPEDVLDSFRITAGTVGGSFDGKVLDIVLHAQGIGSMLDAAITIYNSDGAQVLGTATTNSFDGNADPAIEGLSLAGASSSIYVVVESESAATVPDANQYLMMVVVQDAE